MYKLILRYALLGALMSAVYSFVLEYTSLQKIQVLVYLLIIIVPITLYLAYRELMRKHWDYKLPIIRFVLVGIVITISSSIILAMINFMWRYGTGEETITISRLFFYAFNYVRWYFVFAIGSIPLVYVILTWQLNRMKK